MSDDDSDEEKEPEFENDESTNTEETWLPSDHHVCRGEQWQWPHEFSGEAYKCYSCWKWCCYEHIMHDYWWVREWLGLYLCVHCEWLSWPPHPDR